MKMKRYIYTLIVVCFLSCNNHEPLSHDIAAEAPSQVLSEAIEDEKGRNDSDDTVSKRKLIKKGAVAFETKNIKSTKTTIVKAIKKYSGYISSESNENSTYNNQVVIIVRLPNNNFDDFLNDISRSIVNFDSKNITVKDVTEEFLDISARVKTKKELEKRYLQLLTKAKSVKEVIEVEKELEIVRSDIESIEGRLKFLQDNVSYSTLNIRFYKTIDTVAKSDSFGNKIINAFKNGFEGLTYLFLFLINIWPLFIIILIIYFIIVRKSDKQKNIKS